MRKHIGLDFHAVQTIVEGLVTIYILTIVIGLDKLFLL